MQHFAEEVSRLSEGTIQHRRRSGTSRSTERTTGTRQWRATSPPGTTTWRWSRAAPGTSSASPPSARWTRPSSSTNLDLLEAVLDSDLRTDLLAGLPEAGVVGLDLFPSELRHPFGFQQADAQRGRLPRRGRAGPDIRHDPDVPGGAGRHRGGRSGRRAGATWGGVQLRTDHGAGVATGNITFFPKTESLVIDADVRDRLRDDQWEILQQAAAETRAWLFDNLPDQTPRAPPTSAQRGGRIVAAETADVASLRSDPSDRVREVLEEDAATRDLILAIEDMAPSYPSAEVVTGCPGRAQEPGPAPQRSTASMSRRDRRAQLLEAGVTEPDPHPRERRPLRLDAWTGGPGATRPPRTTSSRPRRRPGRYTYEDERFTFYWNDGGYVEARLVIDRDGTIPSRTCATATPHSRRRPRRSSAAPWFRVSDLPD